MVNIEQNQKIGNFRLFSTNKALINYFATHIMQIATKFRVILLSKKINNVLTSLWLTTNLQFT